jgi:hypothetical protein
MLPVTIVMCGDRRFFRRDVCTAALYCEYAIEDFRNHVIQADVISLVDRCLFTTDDGYQGFSTENYLERLYCGCSGLSIPDCTGTT